MKIAFLKLGAIAAVAFLTCNSKQAMAQSEYWSLVGAACVPVGQNAPGLAFTSAGDVGFAQGQTGEIILICPVPNSVTTATNFYITFRDTDGMDNGVQVVAALRQKSLSDGSAQTLGRAQWDSNNYVAVSRYGRGGAFIGECRAPLMRLNLDFRHFAYYIQVNLRRSDASQTALVGAVGLLNVADSVCDRTDE